MSPASRGRPAALALPATLQVAPSALTRRSQSFDPAVDVVRPTFRLFSSYTREKLPIRQIRMTEPERKFATTQSARLLTGPSQRAVEIILVTIRPST